MYKKLIAAALTLATFGMAGCGTTNVPGESTSTTPAVTEPLISTEDASVQISLSDSEITIDGILASGNTEEAVYIAHDIIYYEDGQGADYGEGSASDAHSAAEANAHTVVHITKPGVYTISGRLSAGQIFVDLGEEAENDPNAVVTLILENADITCTVAPAIFFYRVFECGDASLENAKAEVDTSAAGANVILADDSTNTVTGAYVARIYKKGTTKKLHKYDGAFYSKMSMNISSGEKGNGILNIVAENEGLDSELHLTINGGIISIESMDDGINTNEDGVSVTTINGGTLHINAGLGTEGDGIDSNGYLVINGGEIFTMANAASPDGGIDADADILINGGTLVACGVRNDAVSNQSAQLYMELSFARTITAGSVISLKNGDETLYEFTAEKTCNSLTLSLPELEQDIPYTLYVNGILQQYTSTGRAGMGAFGNHDGITGQTTPEPPSNDLPNHTGKDVPNEENRPENSGTPVPNRKPEGDRPLDLQNGSFDKKIDANDLLQSPSTAFTLTDTIRSFSGVSDSAEAAGKTVLTICLKSGVSTDDIASGRIPLAEAFSILADGKELDAQARSGLDLQLTVTDIPSENYAATALLSDGTDALRSLIPTDGGDYRLSVAVISDVYAGTFIIDFSLEYSAENA